MRKVRIGNDINVRWEVKTDGQAVSLEGKALKLYVRSAYRKEEITTFTVEGCVVSFTYPASMQRMTGARAVILEDATEGAPRRTVCADQAFTLVAHSCEENDDDVEFEDFMVSLQSNVLIGKPGLSAYEVWLSEGNTGTLEDWYAFLRKPATDIAADVAEAEAERKAAEKLRDTAENDRNDAEQERRQHEDARADAEGKRDTAETLRKQAETGRDNAETERSTAEQARKDSEASRVAAEQERTASEQTRQENETARVTAETERKSAEQERTTAETERTTSEQARQENETTRVSAETERVVAELSRQRAEAKREQAAEENKAANDAAVADAYAAADAADTATGKANTAATNADMATANANAAADAASKVNAVLGDDNVLKVTDRTGAEKSLELVSQAAATEMAKNVEQNAADIAELSSKISEERTRVDSELEKKLAKTNISQEPGNSEELVMSQKAVSDKLKGLSTEIIYDVSAHNDGAVFESLQALLNSSNLSTLIPTSVRHGGMSIRFVQSSDNKYVQYRLIANTFSTTVTNWQGVDDEPTTGSNNLVKSGGVADSINKLKNAGYLYAGIATPTTNPGTPDCPVFYIANGKGTYSNFGDIDVTEDEVVVLYYDTVWHKDATGIASNDKLTELEDRTDYIHNDVYGIEGITFEFKDFEDNYFYNTSIPSVSPKDANTSFANLVINCEPKEEFNIKGIGGATARLWAFVKSDGSIISNAEANAGNINEGVTIVAPLETDKLYIQINKNATPSYSTTVKVSTKSSEGVLKRLERCEQTTIEVESISKDVEDSKGNVKFIESVLPSENKAYTFTDFEDGIFWSTYSSESIRGENTSFASIVIDCKPSDKFTVIGIGGASGRLWAFANGTTIITRSEASTGNYEEGTTVIAPEGANTLYVNISKTAAGFDANKIKIYTDDKIIIPINEFVNAKIDEIRKQIGRKASFKLLAVGNSFTLNALNYLAWVMDSVAPDVDYTIGYAIHGGSSLEMHYNYLIGDLAQEAYFKIKKGDNKLTLVKDTTSGKWSDFINDEDWDMITFQQVSTYSGNYTTFQPFLNNIIKNIYSKVGHNIKIGWLLAPSKMIDLEESVTNYNTISDASQQVISKTIATFVLPCGTAIQNLRTTSLQSLGYNLCTDPSNPNISGHLCSGLPWITETYAAAMTILKMLGREDISVYGDKLRPTQDWANGKGLPYTSGEIIHPNVGITDDNCRIAQICAIQAVKNPYEITDCSGLE